MKKINFAIMDFSSKLIQNAVEAFTQLPGVGKKTALRMVMHLLKEEDKQVFQIADALTAMKVGIKFCIYCNNVSDESVCSICADNSRNNKMLCIVENIRDVISIDSTQQYFGMYHVIGGLLSPLDGVGPDQLFLENLVQRVQTLEVEEIIMALNPTVEGDTTMFYISKILRDTNVKISSIARGIAFGADLEYTDELTLARSLHKRLPLESYINIESSK